jgi:uncharacterized protein
MDADLRDALLSIYASAKTIAVVGASATPGRAAHDIPAYLHAQGYRIIPVTPRTGVLFNEHTRASLADIGETPDVVDVFRPAEEAEDVARAAIVSGAKVLWFQPGTETPAAVRLARETGLTVVWGRCMGMTHAELGLGRGP